MRDPRLFEYTFLYDDGNRLRELHYPMVAGASFIESWTYDDRGNLQTHTDPEGKVATFTYDLQNRPLTETHVKNAQTAAAIEKGYDHRGNLVFVWDQAADLLVAYTNASNLPAYDALNRLTEVRWVKEATSVSFTASTETLTFNGSLVGRMAYGYDKTSRVTSAVASVVAAGGFEDHAYAYTYDANGRLDEVRRGGPGQTPVLVADHVWTVGGAKKEVRFSNNHAQVWDYDVKGRVQHLRLRRPDQAISSHLEYEYDERDRRRAIVFHTLQRRVDYGYDDQDRLTSETWTSTAPGQTPPPCQNNIQDLPIGNQSLFAGPVCVTPTSGALLYQAVWTYDGSGNRLTQTVNQTQLTSYAYDAQNRLTSAGAVGYTYTRNGNLEFRTESGVTEAFSYDYMNRMKSYIKGSVSFLYVYMPTGERVTKLNAVSGAEETFFYDGQDVVADYTRTSGGSLSLARTYVNTPRSIDSKLARIEAGGALHFYVGDALGSVHEMMDASGTTVRRELYTAWGEKLPGFAGIDFPDRYAFTQRERDDESALMHYRARGYDPRLGRFLQRDPLRRNRISENYLYAQNAPSTGRDPLGTQTEVQVLEVPSGGRNGKIVFHVNLWISIPDYTAPADYDAAKRKTTSWLKIAENQWNVTAPEMLKRWQVRPLALPRGVRADQSAIGWYDLEISISYQFAPIGMKPVVAPSGWHFVEIKQPPGKMFPARWLRTAAAPLGRANRPGVQLQGEWYVRLPNAPGKDRDLGVADSMDISHEIGHTLGLPDAYSADGKQSVDVIADITTGNFVRGTGRVAGGGTIMGARKDFLGTQPGEVKSPSLNSLQVELMLGYYAPLGVTRWEAQGKPSR